MKFKALKPKTLFIYQAPKKPKRSGETDPTTSVVTTITSTGIFGL